jgi:hypothetical protein
MQTFRFTSPALVRRQASACGLLRAFVAVLAVSLIGNSIAYGQTAAAPAAPKQKLQGLEISKHVKVRETDGSTVKGTVMAVNEDNFLLVPKEGGATIAIKYSQVVKVQSDGMPVAVKVVLWTITVGIGVIILGTFLAFHH